MKFRLQHLCILLALAAAIIPLFFPLVQFIYGATGKVASGDILSISMNCFHVFNNGTITSSTPWALGGLLIAASLCQLFAMLVALFQNYTLQKRVLIFSMLILTGWYILYLVFILILKADATALLPSWTTILPLVSIILCFMAFRAVCRTEARIIASGNSFRLRD